MARHQAHDARIRKIVDAQEHGSGRGSWDGDKWRSDDGTVHTVNSTVDPQVPGGYYHTQVDADGNKATAVYNEDGSLAPIKQNKDW